MSSAEDAPTSRVRYLQAALRHYSVMPLATGSERTPLALESIYQPLRLRQAPFVAGAELGALEHVASDEERASTADAARSQHSARNETRTRMAAHVEAALAQTHTERIVILGGPGSGKTTTLHRVVRDAARRALADDKAPLPLYLALPGLAASGLELDAAAAEAASALLEDTDAGNDAQTRSMIANLARRAVERREVVFCLDGLDEVEPARRSEMIMRLNVWASQAGGVWIIGSRYTEYKGGQLAKGGYSEWELLPLDRPARLELAQRLLSALRQTASAAPPAAARGVRLRPTSLVEALDERPQTRVWAENPLLLSLATTIYARGGALPARRATLFRAVVDAMLSAQTLASDTREALRRRLAGAALRLFQECGRAFTRTQAIVALAEVTPHLNEEEAEHALRQVARAGLIEAPSVGPCSFRHMAFQEYLAGTALADGLTATNGQEREYAWRLAWSKRLYTRWTETLCMMTGALALPVSRAAADAQVGPNEALRWIRVLLAQHETNEGDPGGLGFALAARCLCEFPDGQEGANDPADMLAQTQRAMLDAWLIACRRSFADEDDALTARAWEVADAIGALPTALIQPVVDALIAEARASLAHAPENHINYDDGATRRLRMVVALGFAHALPHVVEQSLSAGKRFGWAAMHALASQGRLPGEVVAALLALPASRGDMVNALYWSAPHGALAPVDLLLEYAADPDVRTRKAIIGVLGSQGDASALPVILAALQAADPSEREVAGDALARMPALAPVEPLAVALHDEAFGVRKAAAHALVNAHAPIPNALLWEALDLLSATWASHWEIPALTTLALAGDERARARLIALANGYREPGWNKQTDICASIAGALGALPNPPLLQMIAIVRDQDAPEELRAQMLGVLGKVAPDTATPLLRELLAEAPYAYIRTQIVGHLMAMGHIDIVDEMVGAPRYRSTLAYEAALALLTLHGDGQALDALRVTLTSNDRLIQQNTLTALNKLASGGVAIPEDMVQGALDMLRSPEQSVRFEAMQLVITLDIPLAEDIWLAWLQSENPVENTLVLRAHPPVGATLPDDVVLNVLLAAERLHEVPRAALARTMACASRETLRTALTDHGILSNVRRSGAFIALWALDEQVSLDWPLIAAQDKSASYNALGAIQICRDALSMPVLETLARSPNPRVVCLAIETLLQRDRRSGTQAGLKALARIPSTEPWHTHSILAALCAGNAPEAIAPLVRQIQRLDDMVTRRADIRVLRQTLERRPDLAGESAAQIVAIARAALVTENDSANDEYSQGDAQRIEGAFLLRALGLAVDPAPLYEMLTRYGANAYDGYTGAMYDCSPALELLASTGEPLPLRFLLDALRHTHPGVRARAITLLAERPEAAQSPVIEQITPLLGDIEHDIYDETGRVMRAASAALRRLAPDTLEQAIKEAQTLLLNGAAGRIFGPIADAGFAEALSQFDSISPSMMAWLTGALDSPHWRVRANAAWALHQHPRMAPDAAIRRLYALRHDPESPFVRALADRALGAILSLETGMEDE